METGEKFRAALNLEAIGQKEDAEKLYWDILRDKPTDAGALHRIGVIRFQRGDLDIAAKLIRNALEINGLDAEAHSNLGLVLFTQRKLPEAIASYQQAIALQPQNPDTYNNLVIALLECGNPLGAVETCRKVLAIKPNYVIAFYNMGVALQQLGKHDEAAAAFKQAIALIPAFPEAYCNLGLAYMSLGKRDEAIAAYKKAIEIRPNFPEAFNNLGQPLNEQGRLEEATEAYRQASILRPGYTDAFVNMAHTLRKRGLLTEAIEACRAGLAITPNNTKAQIELVSLRRQVCDWSNASADMRLLLAHIQEVEPFLLLSAPSSLAEQSLCAKRWSSNARHGTPFSHDRFRKPDRLRIGYLSCDFHRHATAYLMADLFERHDRSRFEIFAYAYDMDDKSEIRQRLVKGFDHFIDVRAMSNDAAAQRIFDDKIDILVDLKGYTNSTRTDILINRPAPIQVNYVGYPGTMGADFIDYIVADPVVAPMDRQDFYHEKIVHLPHCYQPNDTKRMIADQTPTREACGLPATGFVFCCFNAAFKLNPPFFDVWMRLLKAVPDSVMWLIAMNAAVESNLRREASARGIDPQRLVFAPPLHLPEHLARHRNADLFLDTLPYGAHTTASDALWAGLPLLTCMGETFAGRVGASALKAVGLPELITTSLADYEAKALDLATHPEKLMELKQKLKQNLPTAPLFDTAQYTKDLESAYQRMWERWHAGTEPEAFAITRSD